MNRKNGLSVLFVLVLSGVSAWSNQPAKLSEGLAASKPPIQIVSFKKWKQEQIIEARNQVVRLSNQIHLLESKNHQPTKTMEDKSKEIKEREVALDKALKQLQFSKELSMEDYGAVYLPALANNPEALKKIAKSMSSSELAQLLQILLQTKKTTSNQTFNPNGLFSGLKSSGPGANTL